ncbi:MAG: hypothetical protein HC915_15075, partial [Anaerolineae bacterium]|nr:hypothetical protein [Anaerolineae bacterium]
MTDQQTPPYSATDPLEGQSLVQYRADDAAEQPEHEGRWLPGYEKWRTKLESWLEARGAGAISDVVLLLPDMLALALRLVGDPRTPVVVRLQLVAIAIYVVLPFDILPEA